MAKAKTKENKPALTDKQQIFVSEYIACRNASEAARRAGYSEKTAKEIASRLLTNVNVVAAIDEQLDSIKKRGILEKINRLGALNERWEKMQQVIRERAASSVMQGVPGGSTGLLTHDVKGLGRGLDFTVVDVYKVDAALLGELREHEKQAAVELGQWVEKQASTTPDGKDSAPVLNVFIEGKKADGHSLAPKAGSSVTDGGD